MKSLLLCFSCSLVEPLLGYRVCETFHPLNIPISILWATESFNPLHSLLANISDDTPDSLLDRVFKRSSTAAVTSALLSSPFFHRWLADFSQASYMKAFASKSKHGVKDGVGWTRNSNWYIFEDASRVQRGERKQHRRTAAGFEAIESRFDAILKMGMKGSAGFAVDLFWAGNSYESYSKIRRDLLPGSGTWRVASISYVVNVD
jgi:hypothetical protein